MIYIFILFTSLFANVLVLSPYSPSEVDYLDTNDINTINTLFIDGLGNYINKIESSSNSCNNNDCALEELSKTNNSEVVYTRLYKLGNKIIFSGVILDSNKTFESRATAMNVEDMEQVCLRLSKSLALKESLEQVADIDNITEKEQEEPMRRASLSRVGANMGYFFPLGTSFGGDYRLFKIGTSYYHEFKNNTGLIVESDWGGGNSSSTFGGSISVLKFTNILDTSPFYGGGLGLYFVVTPSSGKAEDHKYSGLSFNASAGVMLFRTYDVNVLFRARYLHVLNTDFDNTFIIDFIFQRKMKEKKKKRSGIFFWN